VGDLTDGQRRQPARARALHLLAQTSGPWTVDEVATRLGITAATARKHLDELVRDGVVSCEAERSGRPGRPRLRYRAIATPPADGYQQLSHLLLELVDTGAPPEDVGRRRGTAHRAATEGDPVALLLEVMAGDGFQPELGGDPDRPVVTFHRCPYATAAADHPGVVCALHRGFAAGVLAGDDPTVDIGPLEIREPRLAGCRLHLHPEP
jgi:predicted ArsR family transcriptional regulator